LTSNQKVHLMEKIIILLVLFCLTIFLVTSLVIILSLILAKKNYLNREKSSPFECGFDRNCNHRLPFSLRFFLITIIFLIFDVEIVLLLPSVITFKRSEIIYWGGILIFFLIILIYGVYHEWRQGALNWAI
jgi:NADH-ubiquinone oxidoreductase chain 3